MEHGHRNREPVRPTREPQVGAGPRIVGVDAFTRVDDQFRTARLHPVSHLVLLYFGSDLRVAKLLVFEVIQFGYFVQHFAAL